MKDKRHDMKYILRTRKINKLILFIKGETWIIKSSKSLIKRKKKRHEPLVQSLKDGLIPFRQKARNEGFKNIFFLYGKEWIKEGH